MNFSDFLDLIHPDELAEQLDVSKSTIYLWKSLEAAPAPEIAYKIMELSHHKLNWEDIYKPYVLAKLLYEDANQLCMGF